MRFTGLRIAVSVVAPFAVLACAAHAVSEDTGQSYADVQKFCTTRAQTECAGVGSKCGAKDPVSCESVRTNACLSSQPQGTTYVPEKAKACLDLVTAIYAGATITAGQESQLSTLCGPDIFSGPGAARAPCGSPYDCSSKDGLTCVIPLGKTSGICLKPNPVAPAAPCPNEADQCPDAYFCNAKSLTCTAYPGLGDDCHDPELPCGPGLRCPNMLMGGGCQAKYPKGHACQADGDCADGLCDKAIGQTQGTCTDSIAFSSLDSVCANFK